ncbi:MAG: hypothetical protein U5L96_20240 [Owenweeksia sp.]|nr:hypothetical protein [Owenweeksia sp.]
MLFNVFNAALIIGLIGCSKDAIEDNGTISFHRASESTIDPSNSENEYDYIGSSHNAELIAFVDSMKEADSHESDFIYDLYYVEGLPSKSEMENVAEQSDFDQTEYTGIMDSLYSEHTDAFAHYLEVREIVKNDSTLQKKVNAIRNYENDLDYSGYTAEEEKALKAMFSVARHTIILWGSEK